jgi:hypothetical protein
MATLHLKAKWLEDLESELRKKGDPISLATAHGMWHARTALMTEIRAQEAAGDVATILTRRSVEQVAIGGGI